MPSRPPELAGKNFWRGFWCLADPKISLASFAGMFMAACMAAADYSLSPVWLLLTIAGVFAVEIAKNASGELVDYESGTDLAVAEKDRTPFSGGKRVFGRRLADSTADIGYRDIVLRHGHDYWCINSLASRSEGAVAWGSRHGFSVVLSQWPATFVVSRLG